MIVLSIAEASIRALDRRMTYHRIFNAFSKTKFDKLLDDAEFGYISSGG
jgi:hypothetical protein